MTPVLAHPARPRTIFIQALYLTAYHNVLTKYLKCLEQKGKTFDFEL